jgi:hypothetical protein
MTSGVDGRAQRYLFLFPTGGWFGPARPSGRVRKSVRLDRDDAPDFGPATWSSHTFCHANKEGLSCSHQQS